MTTPSGDYLKAAIPVTISLDNGSNLIAFNPGELGHIVGSYDAEGASTTDEPASCHVANMTSGAVYLFTKDALAEKFVVIGDIVFSVLTPAHCILCGSLLKLKEGTTIEYDCTSCNAVHVISLTNDSVLTGTVTRG